MKNIQMSSKGLQMMQENMPKPGWRRLWITLSLLAYGATIYAAELTGIEHVSDGSSVDIILNTSEAAPNATVFAMENPPRIVLDLPDTDSALSSQPVAVGVGVVQSYSTISAGGRTRLVVDLTRPSTYDYQASGSQVVLKVGDSGYATTAVAASSDATESSYTPAPSVSTFAVDNIDFRRGDAGSSRLVISMNRPGVSVAVNERDNRLLVDLFNSSLPDNLHQRLDVADFATPVQIIDSERRGDGVRMSLNVSGDFEHLAYQSGNDVIVEVKESARDDLISEEDPVQFFEEKTYDGSRVTFNFQDIEVRSVLQLIADVSGLNIVVADSVAGNLTLRLTNVPWDQALDIILDARNLDKRRNGNVIWIAPAAEIAEREQQILQAIQEKRELEPLSSTLIKVSYAKAVDLKDLIEEASDVEEDRGLLSERGSVTIDERTNTLLITDTSDRIAEVRKLVAELDRPVRQVQIESRIVIANSDFNRELGARLGVTHWHVGSNLFSTTGSGEGADEANPGIIDRDDVDEDTGIPKGIANILDVPPLANRYNVNLPASSNSAGRFALSFLSGNYLLDLELSALETEGEGEVVSMPRIVTANQAEGFVKQGVEIPYQQASSSGATVVVFREAVLELRATPLITPDNRIQLDLSVKQDTVGERFSVITGNGTGSQLTEIPAIDKREINTKVLVNNGETVVLGGVSQETRNINRDKVPYLADIPGLGNLFKRKNTTNQKRELMIFVSPVIIEERVVN